MNIVHSAIEASARNPWLEQHERHVELLKQASDAKVIFLGDSLTDAWQYQPCWTADLAKYKPVNLGIGGDRTQHLLWRLQHHQLPRAALFTLLIGTNNILRNRTGEILEGIKACRDEIWRQCPNAKILLMNLLPRQEFRSDPAYRQVCDVNAGIPGLAEGPQATSLDFSDIFQVAGEEHLNYEHVMADHVHLTEKGYSAWTRRVVPVLDRYVQGH
jgi:lysophospholipase L1-like esterase